MLSSVKGLKDSFIICCSHGHMDHVVALPHHVKKRELTSCKPAKYYVPDILVRPLKDICGNFADLNGGNTPLSSPNIVPVIPGQKIEVRDW